MWLLVAMIAVPVIEIALFIEIGGVIGTWATVAIVILTALVGAALLRRQGMATLGALQASLDRGGDPTGPLAHGALILFAGALLLTPGFFTDAVGLALMIPQARAAAIAWLGPRLAGRIVRAGAGRRPPQDDAPIETEYRDVTDRTDPRGP